MGKAFLAKAGLVGICAVGLLTWSRAAQAALLGYWNFDEPTGLTAGSAAAILAPGALQGGVTRTAGRFGGALQLDGASGQVLVANIANLFSTLSDKVTISLWAYGDESLPQNRTIFSAKNATGGRVLQSHLPWGDGRVYWDAGSGAGNTFDRIDKQATTPNIKGQWNHWVFTKDASAGLMKIYLNGQLWQITAPSGTSSAALNKPSQPIQHLFYGSGQ